MEMTIEQRVSAFNVEVEGFFKSSPVAIVGAGIPVYFDAEGKWCAVNEDFIVRFERLTGLCNGRGPFTSGLGEYKVYFAEIGKRKNRQVKDFVKYLSIAAKEG